MGNCCGKKKRRMESKKLISNRSEKPTQKSESVTLNLVPKTSANVNPASSSLSKPRDEATQSLVSSRQQQTNSEDSSLVSSSVDSLYLTNAEVQKDDNTASTRSQISQTLLRSQKTQPVVSVSQARHIKRIKTPSNAPSAPKIPPPLTPRSFAVHVGRQSWGDTKNSSCTEYRFFLPLSVEEFEKAQIYQVSETSKEATGGGSGVEVLTTEPFQKYSSNNPAHGLQGNVGVFTKKIYYLKPFIPAWIRTFLSEELMTMDEEAWNAYPLCKTIITNRKWKPEDCLVQVSSLHVEQDDGRLENALGLPPELLAIRKVVRLDLTDDSLIGGPNSKNYKANEDPKNLRTWDGKGPWLPGWEERNRPKVWICIYKVVAFRLRMSLVGGRIRSWALDKSYPTLFTKFHRQALCSYDSWSRLSLTEIRRREAEVNKELDRLRRAKNDKGPAIEMQA